jgi:hypothetical protein
MDLRPLAFVIGAAAALCLPECNNSGIAGGGGGGAGGASACVPTCGTALVNGGVPCGGGSQDAYNALQTCGCGPNGACTTDCGGNFCMQAPADAACSTCLQKSCNAQITDCAND